MLGLENKPPSLESSSDAKPTESPAEPLLPETTSVTESAELES